MEITATTIIHSTYTNLHFHSPLLHFHLPPSSFRPQFSLSFSTPRFHSPLSTSHSSQFPLLSRSPLPKFLTATSSLADDATFSSSSKVAVADPSLAVKTRAMAIAPELKGTSIFLVGMNNSIKTNLGKLLADGMRYYYFDSDSLVEEAASGEYAGKSFRESDEKGFQESETEVLKQLSSMGRLVVCAGDGAVQSSTNLAFLRHGISIWIDVPVDMVARSLIGGHNQIPSSEISTSGSYSEVLTQLSALYEEMRGRYSIADATISLQKVACQLGYDDLDAVTTEDMTMEVLKEMEKLTRIKKLMEEAARPF